jgi:two-component system, chemotaxis family, sensor histidine kinase and response regulator PixL
MDEEIQRQIYQSFLSEAPQLLHAIEQDLLALFEQHSIASVHRLMRHAHTLKGSAMSVERSTIRTVAHHLEDVFKALYELTVLSEPVKLLLWEGYECLRLAVSTELTNAAVDQADVLDRTASVFAQLQAELGDFFSRETIMPSSEELGFDGVTSIFQDSVQQDLQQLSFTLASQDPIQVTEAFRAEAQFFVGLAESYKLPGLERLAKTVLQVLDYYPDKALEISQFALADFKRARTDILTGDRTLQYSVSEPIEALAALIPNPPSILVDEPEDLSGFLLRQPPASVPDAENISLDPDSEAPTHLVGSSSISKIEAWERPSESVILELLGMESLESPTLELPNLESLESPTLEVVDTDDHVELVIPGLHPVSTSQTSRLLQNIWTGEPASRSMPFSHQPNPTQSKPDQSSTPSGQDVRVELVHLEQLNQAINELLAQQNQQSQQNQHGLSINQQAFWALQRCRQKLGTIKEWSNQRRREPGRLNPMVLSSRRQIRTRLDEIPAEFDTLEMEVYGELDILIQSTIDEMMTLQANLDKIDANAQVAQSNLKTQKRLLTNAQDDLLQARMIPIGKLLNRFSPILNQLMTAYQKPVDLALKGTDILIEKVLSEQLYDPLLHLLRNAFDHGIESPQLRRQQGKRDRGQITVQAGHQGNRTIITIQDDGQGLNWEQIRSKSIELGFLSPSQAREATEAHLSELLFEPGFSATEQVTQLSGRGIGLDVVRNQIQALKGSVTVHSVRGQGTTFSLQIPLTFTTARFLVCQSQGITYALSTALIVQVLSVKPAEILVQSTPDLTNPRRFFLEPDRRRQIPIYSLSSLFAYSYATERLRPQSQEPILLPNRSALSTLVMLGGQSQPLCLEVDRIVGEQELVIKTLQEQPATPSYIQGYSVLSDGQPTLAIDPIELVRQAWQLTAPQSGMESLAPLSISSPDRALRSASPAPSVTGLMTANLESDIIVSRQMLPRQNKLAFHHQSVLIVDDSMTQRLVLVDVLEKAGYSVFQAKEGREALDQLRRNPSIKLVICDIEMPTMNGFEFLHHCRQDPTLSTVDVVMLTSRTSTKHRQMAFDLGAKAYLSKPCLEQDLLHVLLELIGQQKLNLSNSS